MELCLVVLNGSTGWQHWMVAAMVPDGSSSSEAAPVGCSRGWSWSRHQISLIAQCSFFRIQITRLCPFELFSFIVLLLLLLCSSLSTEVQRCWIYTVGQWDLTGYQSIVVDNLQSKLVSKLKSHKLVIIGVYGEKVLNGILSPLTWGSGDRYDTSLCPLSLYKPFINCQQG